MKFTEEEAFEKLKGILTNNGKKTLRMSEKSIKKQLETLMPLIANDEMELEDFVGKVKDTFSVMNSNVEKDKADFIKQWEKDHPTRSDKPQATEPPVTAPSADDATSNLLKRIEELEKKEAERNRENILSQKRKDLLHAMKKKGIKDEQWSKDFIQEINITEDFDIESKADAYLKIYNKSQAGQTGGDGTTPYQSSSTGVFNSNKDPFESVKKILAQRTKDKGGLSNKET